MADNLFSFDDQEPQEQQEKKYIEHKEYQEKQGQQFDYAQIENFVPHSNDIYQPSRKKMMNANNLEIEKSQESQIIKESYFGFNKKKTKKKKMDQFMFEQENENPEVVMNENKNQEENIIFQDNYDIPQQKFQIEEQKNQQDQLKENKKKKKKELKQSINSSNILTFEEIQQSSGNDFLYNPVPQGKIAQCTIKRDKKSGWFYPQYDLYLSNGFNHLLSGIKKVGNTTSNYVISNSKTELQSSGNHFIGKLRSNFIGTQFNVYDNGLNPQKATISNTIRRTLASIQYQSNFFGTKGPRKMKVIIPRVQQDGTYKQFRFQKNDMNLLNNQTKYKDQLIKLINKPPKWNERMKAYVLNFYGRVDKPSVKNFILIQDEQEKDNVNIMLFGRIGQDIFNMDVRYPMSIVQAFGIALSSFDGKLALE